MDLKLSENALTVLRKRYLRKDNAGEISETPEELFLRVAKAVAGAEKSYAADDEQIKKLSSSFYNLMSNLEFMPNSPTLMNAGLELGQLSACFVLPVEDSMEGIFDTLKACALIHKTGGGTGFSFSRLRPKNSVVRTTGGVASGPVSFMKVFDAATQAVKQGGRRRGANMGILRVDHPDILEFIKCKGEEGQISNFNISIAVTDEFMEKVSRNQQYDLIDPRTKQIRGSLNAKEVFDLIVECAYNNGEPGVIFIDKINDVNPVPGLGEIESTNPCGEQPLLPYESCNLGSLNLSKMIRKDADGSFVVDWDKLGKATILAVHFLDNVIDINRFPLPEIEINTLRTRKIGLGVMGWASMLGYLGIAYDSQEALDLAEKVMSFIRQKALDKSCQLAKRKGTFPEYRESVYCKQDLLMRNATLTTIAPTGTISIIAGPCSSGIEPIFALVYFRNVLEGEKLLEIDPAFEEVAKRKGFYSESLLERIAQNNGSIQDISEITQDVKKVFRTSMDIAKDWHIKMQAVFQKYTDNAVSKTINLPNSATAEDIKESYLLAYQLNCKGITVYRDGSRKVQVLKVEKKEPSVFEKNEDKEVLITPKPRPEVIIGTTTKMNTGCGNLYVILNQDEEGGFFEVFTQMGKAGGCAASQLEAVGRLISLALRGGIDLNIIIEQLKGIRCPSPSWTHGKKIFSCADAIAQVLEKRMNDQYAITQVKPAEKDKEDSESGELEKVLASLKEVNVVGVCPDCGDSMRYQEGCVTCASCGYSKC
ncbi:MAG: vitamin B12-dependent ribonucleotide reductase [Candidatus Omnitrophica bacterium]|nr:vitamin B12-dependent ribonucleotide reductase [Candidatus Omnitrophota bacterium]